MKVENSDKEVMENVSSVMVAEARSLFIPGVLFLVCICINFPVVKEKVAHLLWEDPKVTSLVFVGVVCFIAGGLIDFLRATVTSLVQWN